MAQAVVCSTCGTGWDPATEGNGGLWHAGRPCAHCGAGMYRTVERAPVTPKRSPRDLPLDIKQRYRAVTFGHFWSHSTSTPLHLWSGTDVDAWQPERGTLLCGKRFAAGDDTLRIVPAEDATWLCRACVRIALARAAKETT